MEKQVFELQPLRIQGGWKVDYNNFTEYDLATHDKDEAFRYLIEDLLQLSFNKQNTSATLCIDLGWYPNGEIDGFYRLVMVKDYSWSSPLEVIETKLKFEIIAQIEYWVCYDFYSKYL